MLTYKQIISIKGYLHFTFHGERQQEADALCDMALRCEKAEARLQRAEIYLKMFERGTKDQVVIDNCRAYFAAKEANDD
jgi:hypothetical protein